MVRVDFYLLEKQPAAKVYPFAVRLLEKIYKQGQTIFVAMNAMEECQQLNDFLWTHNDISFIPHCLVSDSEVVNSTPIVLGLASELTEQTLYLNFCHVIPKNLAKLTRIIEIIPDEPAWRTMARQKYVEYKSSGAEIYTHKM